ncbi:MAG: YidC/Oxa1 family insertase periplasmic-domain containing protein, partial [bacterium]|nr:YidC/Oxa1 family insertase periplasmic-domain containing protein [bacterium]
MFLVIILAVLGYQVFYYTPKMKEYQAQTRIEEARRAAVLDSLARIAAVEERARDEDLPQTTLTPPPMRDAELTTPVGPAVSTDLPRTGLGSTRYITVTTPLYEMTLSSGGGEIVSIHLLNYETNDEPVQLINWDPDSLSGLGTVTLVGENRRLGTSDVRFAPYLPGGSIPLVEGTALDLDPSSAPKTLIFRSEGADG